MERIVPFTPPARLNVLSSEVSATRAVVAQSHALLAADRERLLLQADMLLGSLHPASEVHASHAVSSPP
jgi:hypothetical protein